jgi:hypothetical protein
VALNRPALACRFKAHWLGRHYYTTGFEANGGSAALIAQLPVLGSAARLRCLARTDIHMTNVPNIRFQFRRELLEEERVYVASHCQDEDKWCERQPPPHPTPRAPARCPLDASLRLRGPDCRCVGRSVPSIKPILE